MTENKNEISTVKSKRPIRRTLAIMFMISGLAILLALYIINSPKPASGMAGLKLGMSEMDVTLVYGSTPDCVISESDIEKVWAYDYAGRHCDATLDFTKEDSSFKLTRICGGMPPEHSINYSDDEESAVSKLGKPSFISVNEDGTQKVF